MKTDTTKLVGLPELRLLLWSEESRPHLDTVRKMAQRGDLPGEKIGRCWFFDVDKVRKALQMNGGKS